MENEHNFFKKIAIAGLTFLGGELHAQNFDHWVTVTPQEWKRRNISSEGIDTVDLRQGEALPVDNSKMGRVYSDRNGNTFYWINTHPGIPEVVTPRVLETVESNNEMSEKNAGEQAKDLLQDPELISSLENFQTNFEIRSPSAVVGEDIIRSESSTTRNIISKGSTLPIPSDIPNYSDHDGVILIDKKKNKSVLIKKSSDEKLYYLTVCLSGGDIKEGISLFLGLTADHNMTAKEKKKLLRDLFVDSIPNAVNILPEYKPLVLYDREQVLKILKGSRTVSKKELEESETFNDTREIKVDNKMLDDILKEDK